MRYRHCRHEPRRIIVARAFSLLLGIPEGECSGVFIAENATRWEALHYTYRETL